MGVADPQPFASHQMRPSAEQSANQLARLRVDRHDEVVRRAQEGANASVSANEVADLIAGTSSIGYACAALRSAGWRATIAGNRITVNDEVFVHYAGVANELRAAWMIYAVADPTPIWVAAGSLQS